MDDDPPAHLTIEEWLLAQNIEWLQRLHEQGDRNHQQALKNNRLKRVSLAVLLVVFVIVVALSWQVKVRNQRLEELKATTTRIEDIAEEFRQDRNDSSSGDVAEGLRKIDLLCDRFDCETEKE